MTSTLYALGSNSSGQLGIGSFHDASETTLCMLDRTTPFTLPEGEAITKIRGGGNHTLLLTSLGGVFVAGDSSSSLPHTANQNYFQNLNVPTVFQTDAHIKVTDIATTWSASFFVLSDQIVYSCGVGTKGELGLGEQQQSAATPQPVLDLGMYGEDRSTVRAIEGGLDHVVLMTSDGELYGWGTARKGQLGDAAVENKMLWAPWRVGTLTDPRYLALGRNYTFIGHATGQKTFLGDSKHFFGQEPLELSEDCMVTSGWSNLYALNAGKIQATGRNDRGQVPSADMPPLCLLMAGSEHAVGCTVDGAVVAFGWGEHGNCGKPLDVKGNVAGRYNIITVPNANTDVVCLIGAGCATTFIGVKVSANDN